jgi:hypothetical protein
MPKITDKTVEEVMDQKDDERTVGAGLIEGRLGVVNARVVYLGSRRNRQQPLKGTISVSRFDDGGAVEEIADSGFTPYDFSSHDLRGRLMEKKLIPMDHPNHKVRGRPFCIVKHPDHLWAFHKSKDAEGNHEFEILAGGKSATLLDEYFIRRTRALRAADEDFSAIRTGATASDAIGAE